MLFKLFCQQGTHKLICHGKCVPFLARIIQPAAGGGWLSDPPTLLQLGSEYAHLSHTDELKLPHNYYLTIALSSQFDGDYNWMSVLQKSILKYSIYFITQMFCSSY